MEHISLQELQNKYLYICEHIRNYSHYTLLGYKDAFRLFQKETPVRFLHEYTKDSIQQWFFYGRATRKWSTTTFRHYHKRFNTFNKWLVKEGYMESNILENIELPRMEKKLPRTLTKEQSLLVLDTSYHMPYAYKFEKYRNRAIIGLMLLAGLRRGEVFSLKLQHVSIENQSIFIQQGKGKKDRIVPINRKLTTILQDYLKDRGRLKKENIYFITQVQKDAPITERAIANLVKKIREKTKIDFSAHTLRHAFARLMLEGGCDIYTLSRIMGHAKITTTTIYLACSSQQMHRSVEKHTLNFS